MKARLAPSLLTLGLLIASSLANAQAVASGFGLNITQSDSHTTSSGNTVNVNSGATTGGTDAHAATIQLLATVTYTGTGDTKPSSVTVSYRLTNQANGDVTLGGMTPPSGTGVGYASVQNLVGNTTNINRGTSNVNAYVHAGPANLDKSVTVSVTHDWTDNHDGTYTTWVVLETETLTTRAHIDSAGSGSAAPVDGSGDAPSGGPQTIIPGDSASGYAAQTIKAVTP